MPPNPPPQPPPPPPEATLGATTGGGWSVTVSTAAVDTTWPLPVTTTR